MLPSAEQQVEMQEIDEELAKLRKVFALSSPGLQAEQTKWEAEIKTLLASTEPADFAWVDDAQANGGRNQGTWKFVGKTEAPVYSKERSHAFRLQHQTNSCNTRLTMLTASLRYLKVINSSLMSG